MPRLIIDMPNKPKVEMDLKDADKVSIAEAMAGGKKGVDELMQDPKIKSSVYASHRKERIRLADKFVEVFQKNPTKFLEARQEMLDTEDDWEYYEKRVFERLRIVIEKNNND